MRGGLGGGDKAGKGEVCVIRHYTWTVTGIGSRSHVWLDCDLGDGEDGLIVERLGSLTTP